MISDIPAGDGEIIDLFLQSEGKRGTKKGQNTTRRDGLNGPGDGLQEALETVCMSPKMVCKRPRTRSGCGHEMHGLHKASRGDYPQVAMKWQEGGMNSKHCSGFSRQLGCAL